MVAESLHGMNVEQLRALRSDLEVQLSDGVNVVWTLKDLRTVSTILWRKLRS